MIFDIPKHCHIRWQAALAVLEDLQEDIKAPFNMRWFADDETVWEKTNGCGTAACFAGYVSISPYCHALDYPADDYQSGSAADFWLMGGTCSEDTNDLGVQLFDHLFSGSHTKSSRARTLAFLERRIKKTFKESTGKSHVAPMTFYV